MRQSDIKDFEKLFESLERLGWEPMVCDTPMTFYDNEVPCGVPNGVGDVVKDEQMIPRKMLTSLDDYAVRAKGDSMIGAGIQDGDVLQVATDMPITDGDVVLAWMDGDYTVKTYCEDKEGHPWLVPQNEEFDAIRMEDHDDAFLVGVITRIHRRVPRIKYRSCMDFIERAQKKGSQQQRGISPVQVSRAIQGVAPMVEVARQWYAVYRVLVDERVWKNGDFKGFCDRVRAEVPEHGHLPVAEDIQRMDVGTFSKAVVYWDEMDAPVQGKRFKRYVEIAQMMDDLLMKE